MTNAATRSVFPARMRPSASFRLLRIGTIAVLTLWLPLAMCSGYRAIVQVYDLAIAPLPPTIGAGTVIGVDVVSSGRATVDVVLELVQDNVVDTVGSLQVAANRDPALDPRRRRGEMRVRLTDQQLEKFGAGTITVRARAIGRSQWLRTPPPTVAEGTVLLAAR